MVTHDTPSPLTHSTPNASLRPLNTASHTCFSRRATACPGPSYQDPSLEPLQLLPNSFSLLTHLKHPPCWAWVRLVLYTQHDRGCFGFSNCKCDQVTILAKLPPLAPPWPMTAQGSYVKRKYPQYSPNSQVIWFLCPLQPHTILPLASHHPGDSALPQQEPLPLCPKHTLHSSSSPSLNSGFVSVVIPPQKQFFSDSWGGQVPLLCTSVILYPSIWLFGALCPHSMKLQEARDEACFCSGPRTRNGKPPNICYMNVPQGAQSTSWSEANELPSSITTKHFNHIWWGGSNGKRTELLSRERSFVPLLSSFQVPKINLWMVVAAKRSRGIWEEERPSFQTCSSPLQTFILLFSISKCQQIMRNVMEMGHFKPRGFWKSFLPNPRMCCHYNVPTSSLCFGFIYSAGFETEVSLLFSNDNSQHTPAYSHNVLRKY